MKLHYTFGWNCEGNPTVLDLPAPEGWKAEFTLIGYISPHMNLILRILLIASRRTVQSVYRNV